jgi:hypothetical protein
MWACLPWTVSSTGRKWSCHRWAVVARRSNWTMSQDTIVVPPIGRHGGQPSSSATLIQPTPLASGGIGEKPKDLVASFVLMLLQQDGCKATSNWPRAASSLQVNRNGPTRRLFHSRSLTGTRLGLPRAGRDDARDSVAAVLRLSDGQSCKRVGLTSAGAAGAASSGGRPDTLASRRRPPATSHLHVGQAEHDSDGSHRAPQGRRNAHPASHGSVRQR